MIVIAISFLVLIPIVMVILSVGENHRKPKKEPLKVYKEDDSDDD